MIHVVSWLIVITAVHSVYHHTYLRWGHGLKAEFAAMGAGVVFGAALTVGWVR